mmetsp:Transcript_71513/g.198012  ORF Transcript_71513/g.198012 Transcript_71513/m.198012 type:complete len:128 (-) Transcript_71513:149-532(-)
MGDSTGAYEEDKKEVLVRPGKMEVLLSSADPPPLYSHAPGLRPIKQMEMFEKWRDVVPREYWNDTCPKPAQEVIDMFKKGKKEKAKEKREAKKAQQATHKQAANKRPEPSSDKENQPSNKRQKDSPP